MNDFFNPDFIGAQADTENKMTNTQKTDDMEKNEKNQIVPGTLYLVATPIGNLMDLSARALKVLAGVDFVAAEDTRVAAKLLGCFDLKKSMVSYFEHNMHDRGKVIVRRLQSGESCALVTDAGTPAISDPGEELVALCHAAGVKVTAVPGCCAAIDALSLSGLPTGKFVFEGFLSATDGEKRRRLEAVKQEQRTLIFYEAPHRLPQTLVAMLDVFGQRRIALCRELTKRNEEIMRTTLQEATAFYRENAPRGEYVLIVEGCSDEAIRAAAFWSDMSIEEHMQFYLTEDPNRKKNDAVKLVARDRGVPKNVIYHEVNCK